MNLKQWFRPNSKVELDVSVIINAPNLEHIIMAIGQDIINKLNDAKAVSQDTALKVGQLSEAANQQSGKLDDFKVLLGQTDKAVERIWEIVKNAGGITEEERANIETALNDLTSAQNDVNTQIVALLTVQADSNAKLLEAFATGQKISEDDPEDTGE